MYLCVSIWHSEISFNIRKSTFGSIKRCCKSDRESKLRCVWSVFMKNILKVGTGDLGACIQLRPDGFSTIVLLSSGSSSIIRTF